MSGRSRAGVLLGCAMIAAAVLVPGDALEGDLSGVDAAGRARVEMGVLLWRLSLSALGAVVVAVSRLSGEGAIEAAGEPARTKKRLLAALFLGALVIRLPGLGGPLWFDELWTVVDLMRGSFFALVSRFGSDNHHPLSSILSWISVRCLGESAVALRLPALLFGAASVPAFWLFARRRIGPLECVAATAVLGLSFHHVTFSQNARGYTALLFFAILSTDLLTRLLERPRRRTAVAYAVTLALATFTHLTAVYLALAHLVTVLIAGRRDRRAAAFGLAALSGATLTSVFLHSLMLPQMLHFFLAWERPVVQEASWTNPWWTVVAAARSLGAGTGPGLAALALGASAFVAGACRLARRHPETVIGAVVPAAAGAAVMLAQGRNLWPRFFFFLAGFAVVIAVHGACTIAAFVARRLFPHRDRVLVFRFAVCAALIAGAAATLPRAWLLPKQDFESPMAYIEETAAADDVVFTAGLAILPYEAYYRAPYRPLVAVEELDRARARGVRVFVIYTFPIYLESRSPDLWEAINERGREVYRAAGSIGDGDVVIVEIVR